MSTFLSLHPEVTMRSEVKKRARDEFCDDTPHAKRAGHLEWLREMKEEADLHETLGLPSPADIKPSGGTVPAPPLLRRCVAAAPMLFDEPIPAVHESTVVEESAVAEE